MPHIRLINRASRQSAEDRRVPGHLELLADSEPAFQERQSARITAHDATFIPFAVSDGDRAGLEVDISFLERECLSDPKTAAPAESDESFVPDAGGCSSRTDREKALNVLRSQVVLIKTAHECHPPNRPDGLSHGGISKRLNAARLKRLTTKQGGFQMIPSTGGRSGLPSRPFSISTTRPQPKQRVNSVMPS